MRSKAVVLDEQRKPPKVEEVEVLPPRTGEVMVRVAATGVCHSDYNLVDGFRYVENLPMVMGHEASGVIEEIGPGRARLRAGGPGGVRHPAVVRRHASTAHTGSSTSALATEQGRSRRHPASTGTASPCTTAAPRFRSTPW